MYIFTSNQIHFHNSQIIVNYDTFQIFVRDCNQNPQQIGRAGRDGKQASALMFHGKQFKRHCENPILTYCDVESCRRDFLFRDFSSYKRNNDVSIGCKCCDNCSRLYKCIVCTYVLVFIK